MTRQPGVQSYIQKYMGPSFAIEFRRSNVLYIVSMAFIFGPLFPMLYLIVCLSLSVLFVVERLYLCYWCREPPAYDEVMTVS